MNALLNMIKVGNIEDLKGLRQLHNKVEGHMRGLKSLEVDSKSYGSLLIPVLLEKLPKELRLEATRKLKGNWELDELVQIFKEERRHEKELVCYKVVQRIPHISKYLNLNSNLQHLYLPVG